MNRSKQINFFLTEQELNRLLVYLVNNDWLICENKTPNSSLKRIDSFSEKGLSFLVPKGMENNVVVKFIENQNYYTINTSQSCAIEFYPSKFDAETNTIRRGRLYYEFFTYNLTENDIRKPDEFLKKADELFKWFKKQFKDAKLPDYKGFFVSSETQKLLTKIKLDTL